MKTKPFLLKTSPLCWLPRYVIQVLHTTFSNFFQVYYNLGEFETSMKYALVAGSKFDFDLRTEYIETIVCKFSLISFLHSFTLTVLFS